MPVTDSHELTELILSLQSLFCINFSKTSNIARVLKKLLNQLKSNSVKHEIYNRDKYDLSEHNYLFQSLPHHELFITTLIFTQSPPYIDKMGPFMKLR